MSNLFVPQNEVPVFDSNTNAFTCKNGVNAAFDCDRGIACCQREKLRVLGGSVNGRLAYEESYCVKTRPTSNTCPFSATNGTPTPSALRLGLYAYKCCGLCANTKCFCNLEDKPNIDVLDALTNDLDTMKSRIEEGADRTARTAEDEKANLTEMIATHNAEARYTFSTEVAALRKKRASNKTIFVFSDELYDTMANKLEANIGNFEGELKARTDATELKVTELILSLEADIKIYKSKLLTLTEAESTFESVKFIAAGYKDFLTHMLARLQRLYNDTKETIKQAHKANYELHQNLTQIITDGRKEFYISDVELFEVINSTARLEITEAVKASKQLVNEKIRTETNVLTENRNTINEHTLVMLSNTAVSSRYFAKEKNTYKLTEAYKKATESHNKVISSNKTIALTFSKNKNMSINSKFYEKKNMDTKSNIIGEKKPQHMRTLTEYNKLNVNKNSSHKTLDLHEFKPKKIAAKKKSSRKDPTLSEKKKEGVKIENLKKDAKNKISDKEKASKKE